MRIFKARVNNFNRKNNGIIKDELETQARDNQVNP